MKPNVNAMIIPGLIPMNPLLVPQESLSLQMLSVYWKAKAWIGCQSVPISGWKYTRLLEQYPLREFPCSIQALNAFMTGHYLSPLDSPYRKVNAT